MNRDIVDWHLSSEDTHGLTSLIASCATADYASLYSSLRQSARESKKGRRAKSSCERRMAWAAARPTPLKRAQIRPAVGRLHCTALWAAQPRGLATNEFAPLTTWRARPIPSP